jgi:pantetheine-phosphate adenylyltransferase
VAVNTNKKPLFTLEERLEILREETADIPNIEISSFDGLTMDYADKIHADCVIRGIRVVSDFEYEFQMALMNRALNSRVESLFMPPAAEHLFISSSLIKEVLMLGGDVSRFVPPSTERHLRRKLNRPATG